MYYIYKERYNEENDALNKKDTKKFDNIKIRLADYYFYESEEKEEQEKRQTDTNSDNKNHLKNQQQMMTERLAN